MDEQDRADIDTYKGVPFADSFTLVDAAGTPVPLSGRAATCHLYRGTPEAPGTLALTVSTANGKLTLDAVTGTVSRSLTAADMAGLAAGEYWYELVITNGGAVEHRPCWGWDRHRPTGVSP